MSDTIYDVAIVGGGPAGLHAAAKAALLFRTAVLFDKGRKHSRIYWSPKVANLPGRHGESGREILEKGHAMIRTIEADLGRTFVTLHEETPAVDVRREEDGFVLIGEGPQGRVEVHAKAVVFATGTIDRQPQLAQFRRRDIEAVLPFANKGLADYCLLCDGHTVEGKNVAVIGCSPEVRGIAKSLKKNFGANTALVPMCNAGQTPHEGGPGDPADAWSQVEKELAAWDIPIHYGGVKAFTGIREGRFGIQFEDGSEQWFDKAWISMGWYKVNSELVAGLGATLDTDGFVVTDEDGAVIAAPGAPSKQKGSDRIVPGVYVIGDLRSHGWKQIPVAWGQAETAIIDIFVR